MPVSDTLLNTIFDGRYRILRKLGVGGMANVYLAEDEELGRRVAIKILNERYANDEPFVERFRREAKSAAGLSHPNIVSIYDRGEAEGTYYIAMEVVEGRSLKDLIIDRGRLPIGTAIGYTRQILAAVRFAHRKGIIHRDIKPHNILIGAEERLKVTDFGIARAGASQMTEVGSIMGTAQYLSPEQARGTSVTEASDLYSVGVVLYEMLTGQVPFGGDSPLEIAMKHLNEAPRPPSEAAGRNGVPEELDHVVLRALSKDPDDRYRDAADFDDDLERVAGGLPVARQTSEAATAVLTGLGTSVGTQVLPREATRPRGAPPPPTRRPPPGYRYDEPPRRRRRSFLPWLLVVALLAAAAAAGYYVWTQIQEELQASQPISVPLVEGLQRDNAVARIRDAGLRPVVEEEPNADTEAGIVFRQNPEAGTKIARDQPVTIFVSTGPPTSEVPDVVGMPVDEAVETIEQAQLEAETREAFSERPEGEVIRQRPRAGEEVEHGTSVRLTVSKGREMVRVPSVVGQDQASAVADIEAAELEANVFPVPNDAPAGTVVAQDPQGGADAPRGSGVRINVSEGPQTAAVPDVTGREQSEAEQQLRDAGFQVAVNELETNDESLDGVVVGQDPGGGTEAQLGSTVRIAVARFVEPEPTTTGESEGPGPSGGEPPGQGEGDGE